MAIQAHRNEENAASLLILSQFFDARSKAILETFVTFRKVISKFHDRLRKKTLSETKVTHEKI